MPALAVITAAAIQSILLGLGGFLGTTMAGVGFFRLTNSVAKGANAIPGAIVRSADELSHIRKAIETDNALAELVSQQTKILQEIYRELVSARHELVEVRETREAIGRELRIISRKVENTGNAPREIEGSAGA